MKLSKPPLRLPVCVECVYKTGREETWYCYGCSAGCICKKNFNEGAKGLIINHELDCVHTLPYGCWKVLKKVLIACVQCTVYVVIRFCMNMYITIISDKHKRVWLGFISGLDKGRLDLCALKRGSSHLALLMRTHILRFSRHLTYIVFYGHVYFTRKQCKTTFCTNYKGKAEEDKGKRTRTACFLSWTVLDKKWVNWTKITTIPYSRATGRMGKKITEIIHDLLSSIRTSCKFSEKEW